MLLQCYRNRSISQHFLLWNRSISIGSRLSKSTHFADQGHSIVKEISQQFRKSIARTPDCCDYVVRRYSIARLLRENRLGCRFSDLTDSRRVESKSSYSANRQCEIEIFRKRVSTGSRDRSETACYFATISRILIAVEQAGFF